MVITFSSRRDRESYAMKFERLTVAHHQLSAGFQHDALAIFGDDLDLVHGAEVAVQRIVDLLADIISHRGATTWATFIRQASWRL